MVCPMFMDSKNHSFSCLQNIINLKGELTNF